MTHPTNASNWHAASTTMNRHISVFPPAHPMGTGKLWFWTVRENGIEVSCGTDTDADGALEHAMLAMGTEPARGNSD